ncbi:MAG TPA: fused response regulator/phosphatase [Terriglobia bacterium]|nr:fused response regulator/phosphatase [Terriglobia bacterium]
MKLPRILVVDDDPGMLRAVERVLSQAYEVAGTRLPREALRIMNEFKPDLAVVDVRMPEMDGFELMHELKKTRADVDIILMTGSVHEIDAHLIRAIREKAFYFLQKPFDREVLLTLVARCLELRRLERDNRRHLKRLEREIADARAFQQTMLPPERGRIGNVSVFARYTPCSELGGDLYDYVASSAGAALLIADVSGHGASAAMLTGIVKSAFRSAGADDYSPLSVLERVHTGVRAFGDERFISLVCMRWFARESKLEYVSGGHPPAVLWGRESTPTLIHATGPIISPAFPQLSLWNQETLKLRGQNRVLLFTDGISDVYGDTGPFGFEGIMHEISKTPGGGLELLDCILESIRNFSGGRPFEDDCTLLTATLA